VKLLSLPKEKEAGLLNHLYRREEKQRDRVKEVIVQAMESNKAKPIYRVKERRRDRKETEGEKRRCRFEVESSLTVNEIRERKFISCFTTPFPGSEQTIYAFGLLSPT